MQIVTLGQGADMEIIMSPFYWDKKIKIAILTLATFIALC
jgi:hypothetical protein